MTKGSGYARLTTYCLCGGEKESGSKSGYLSLKNLCSKNQILYQTFDNLKRDVSHVTMKTSFSALTTSSDAK